MTLLFAESEEELQRVVNEFHNACMRRKLKVNAGKRKVFERWEADAVDFSTPYRVSVPAIGRYEVLLEGERMKKVKAFEYLGTVLCKHGEKKGKIRQSCEWQVCQRITCKGYERKKSVHRGKKRFKEQYSPANVDVWIKDMDME